MLAESLLQRLRDARHVAVFTGAGMSAESGIPTFRDRFDGLWAKYDPEDVATPSAFRAKPQFVWDWHVYLADAVRTARPNPGHDAVASLEQLVPNVTVLTQNIDNLHQAAGSRNVVELHGNLFRLKAFVDTEEIFAGDRSPVICPVCDGYAIAEECDPYAGKEDFDLIELKAGTIPRCPGCQALLRPDVVWFGEPLDAGVLDKAWSTAETCDVMICIGSSMHVEPAASIPWRVHRRGALIVEINPEPTELSALDDVVSLIGFAGEVLPRLVQIAWGK
jgi:NAD-dependent deacetylase